jgi:hypothetical protein
MVVTKKGSFPDTDITQADELIAAPSNNWCCMHHMLSLQQDFVNEKPLLQHYLEDCGHEAGHCTCIQL